MLLLCLPLRLSPLILDFPFPLVSLSFLFILFWLYFASFRKWNALFEAEE
jgi:hypothetical protein